MMGLIKIAIRNLIAHKRRTIFTSLIMIISVVAINLTGGFINYTYEGLRESMIRSRTGHLQILPQNEETGKITNYREIEQMVIQKIPEVITAAPRLNFTGLITSGEESFVFLAEGIEPEKEKGLRRFAAVTEGNVLDVRDTFAVVVGVGLKEDLNVAIGDVVTILSTTVDGVVNAIDAQVKGVISTGVKEYDKRVLITPLSLAQILLDTDDVSNIAILLEKTAMTNRVKNQIDSLLENPDIKVKTWSQLLPYYHQVVGLYNSIYYFLCTILGVIIFFAVIGVLFLNYFERIGEIGIMRAIGTPQHHIFILFILEGIGLAIFSGIVGTVLSSIFSRMINNLHLMTPPPPGYSAGYLVMVYNSPEIMLSSVLFIVLISIIASIIPGIKGVRTNIVEAIRYV
ncbi:MAG: ABC transporter permease [bacterium]